VSTTSQVNHYVQLFVAKPCDSNNRLVPFLLTISRHSTSLTKHDNDQKDINKIIYTKNYHAHCNRSYPQQLAIAGSLDPANQRRTLYEKEFKTNPRSKSNLEIGSPLASKRPVPSGYSFRLHRLRFSFLPRQP
jgi:hypothetical protein